MKLIGIAAPAGAGKDTVADYLVRQYSFLKFGWADPLKWGLREMGFPEPVNRADKEAVIPGFDFSWRQAAQRLGTEWGRELDKDIWIKLMQARIERAGYNGYDKFVISDVRFENEAAMIREAGGCIWHIEGRAVDLGSAADHASETGIEYAEGDEILVNASSFDELYEGADALLRGGA